MHTTTRPYRRGFTIVELLVVIAVMTLMLTLLVGASYRFIVGARESATDATITKVNSLLQDRLRAFQQNDFTDAAVRYATVTGYPKQYCDMVIRKSRLKRAFPQCFAESPDATRFGSDPFGASNPLYDRKYESGIFLYAILTKGETFGAQSITADAFTGSEVKTTPQTANLPCLVDAWGEPLRFYRWPTRLIKPTGAKVDRTFASLLIGNILKSNFGADGLPGVAYVDDDNANGTDDPGEQGWYGSDDVPNCGPDGKPGEAGVDDDNANGIDDVGELGWLGTDDIEPLNIDPDDPLLRLLTTLNSAAKICMFETGVACGNTPDLRYSFHTPFTYAPMLIMSSGADRKLGLFEPWNASNYGYLAAPDLSQSQGIALQYLVDNPTNLNLKPSGK